MHREIPEGAKEKPVSGRPWIPNIMKNTFFLLNIMYLIDETFSEMFSLFIASSHRVLFQPIPCIFFKSIYVFIFCIRHVIIQGYQFCCVDDYNHVHYTAHIF